MRWPAEGLCETGRRLGCAGFSFAVTSVGEGRSIGDAGLVLSATAVAAAGGWFLDGAKVMATVIAAYEVAQFAWCLLRNLERKRL